VSRLRGQQKATFKLGRREDNGALAFDIGKVTVRIGAQTP
jgi:hypothetical protein